MIIMPEGDVKGTFDEAANDYDNLITRLTPFYEELQRAILDALPFSKTDPIEVLDLGVGTGELTLKVLESYPASVVLGVDFSDRMVGIAKKKLVRYEDRASYLEEDFRRLSFKRKFDAVVSTLSIHHLDDEDKRTLYLKIYGYLKDRGCFFNGDRIKTKSTPITEMYEARWHDYLKSQGLTESELEAIIAKSRQEDKPSSLGDQLTWLREAGFSGVECPVRYYNYAVFGGYKRSSR